MSPPATSATVLEQVLDLQIIPVITIDTADQVLPLADALTEGGLPIVEIALRTSASFHAIRLLKSKADKVAIGVGTVLTVDQLAQAHDEGAQFAVAPGFSPDVVAKANQLRMPILPGVATATEIQAALGLGQKLLKFFPAGPLGGVKMLQALAAPFALAEVRFVPTGGVNADNLADYLALDCVAAVGGGWLAPQDDIKQGRWEAITGRCREAVAIARQTKL